MSDDRLTQRLMQIFLGELDEHVRALVRDLLQLEAAAGEKRQAELVRGLFRTAHSFKGAAHALEQDLIESACHLMESLFALVRDGRLAVGEMPVSLLLSVADGLADAGQRLRSDLPLASGPLPALLADLAAAGSGAAALAGGPPSRPPDAIGPAVAETEVEVEVDAVVEAAPPNSRPVAIRLSADKLDSLLQQSATLAAAQRGAVRGDPLLELHSGMRRQRQELRRLARRVDHMARSGARPDELAQAAASLARLGDSSRRIEMRLQQLAGQIDSGLREMARSTEALDSDVRRVRMLPFGEVCEGLERLVRDVAAGVKQARLVVTGGEIEIDRSVLESLKDPLFHLVRNAVDHGIEAADERIAAGKPAAGEVHVAAQLRGDRVEVSVIDDGRGLRVDAIRSVAARDRALPDDVADADLVDHIFRPGFTTAAALSRVSGRGVGLDVVKEAVSAMRGTIDVAFEAGRGTRFRLLLPLTLTTVRAVTVEAGGRRFGIDSAAILQLMRPAAADIHQIEGRPLLMVAGRPVPVLRLAALLGLPVADAGSGRCGALALAGSGGRQAVLLVDALLGEQELLVRNLGPRLRGAPFLAAAALLPDASVLPILDPAALVAAAGRESAPMTLGGAAPTRRYRILVADDSVTVRTLQKTLLEAAGYDVVVAADGAEAWSLLQGGGIDLVVSDVEMPGLDGFALVQRIRDGEATRDLPVVLVTALGSAADRERGLTAGADAYVAKSAFDQGELLHLIGRLL